MTLAQTTGSQASYDTHSDVAAGTPQSSAKLETFSKELPLAASLSPGAIVYPITNRCPPRGPILRGNGYLALLADTLSDMEGLRIATENRLRQLTRTEADSDGELRGYGLDARSPEVATAQNMLDGLKVLEHGAELSLKRELRKSPLHAWAKREKGVGDKQAARLIAVLGDPYWNDLHDRPRTVSELWAYCGYSVLPASQPPVDTHTAAAGGTPIAGGQFQIDAQDRHAPGIAQSRRKGERSNWSPDAKMRTYLVAVSCMKSPGGRYRGVYEAAREQYADALHQSECKRCGPAGQPALVGSPLSAGHQHARAIRRVSKEILKDLWLEARAIHEGVSIRKATSQPAVDHGPILAAAITEAERMLDELSAKAVSA